MSIGEKLNINKCPHSNDNDYLCERCKVKSIFDEYMKCPHNIEGTESAWKVAGHDKKGVSE